MMDIYLNIPPILTTTKSYNYSVPDLSSLYKYMDILFNEYYLLVDTGQAMICVILM